MTTERIHNAYVCPVSILLILILFLMLLPSALAQGPVSFADFYGSVYVEGGLAPVGTEISAIGRDGQVCGVFTVKKDGMFGMLSCYDFPAHATGQVIGQRETVIFTIDGQEAIAVGNTSWISGSQTRIKLVLEEDVPVDVSLPFTEVPSMDSMTMETWILLVLGLLTFFGIAIFIVHAKKRRQ